jgi:hypothetical protein
MPVWYKAICSAALAIIISCVGTAATIRVPADVPTIQGAIDAAANRDTVLVSPGTYYENINFRGKKIVVASEYLLSGDVSAIAATIINGSQPAHPDTASCVIMASGEDSSSVLEGFTLTGGTGTIWQDHHNLNLYREGGGILTDLTSPVIRNNVIRGNKATNTVGVTSAGGAGIRCSDGYPKILNNIIIENQGRYGGGIVLNYCGGLLRNNIVARNTGGEDFGGSGIWMYAAGPKGKTIENNVVADNTSALYGGGMYVGSTSVVVKNTIFWDNTSSDIAQISLDGGNATMTYCDVQGGWPGASNFSQNPLFADTSFVLLAGSPCIDAGDPSASYFDMEDPSNPGHAKLPSLGMLRNDRGAYGGPSALPFLRIDSKLNHPLPPSAVSAYSDFSTPSSAAIRWTDPTQYRDGSPLQGFSIRVYRDSLQVALVDSGVGTFTDNGLLLHRQYKYSLITAIPSDTSGPSGASVYSGGAAQPAPVGSFDVRDGVEGILISWKNPSRQIDGTPLNDLGGVQIYRDSIFVRTVAASSADTGKSVAVVDTITGYHTYSVIVKDSELPANYSVASSALMGFGGVLQRYNENFDTSLAGILVHGTWDTTSVIAHSGLRCFTSSPSGPDPVHKTNFFMTPPVILGQHAFLRFAQMAILGYGSTGFIEISHDNRKTFSLLAVAYEGLHPGWEDGVPGPGDWFYQTNDLSSFAGDTVVVRFRLVTGSLVGEGWYCDDLMLGSFPGVSDVSVRRGWNLLSTPYQITPVSPENIFPGAASRPFIYQANRYQEVLTAASGTGYWVRYDTSGGIPMAGTMAAAETIAVHKGWNLVGSITFPFASAEVVSVPPGIILTGFTVFDSVYRVPAVVQPGEASWVKVAQDGAIVISAQSQAPGVAKQVARMSASLPEGTGTILFTDAAGTTKELYLLPSGTNAGTAGRFDCPPVPPAGCFDIRFGSQSLAMVTTTGESGEERIELQSVRYPLTVRWDGVHVPVGTMMVTQSTEVRLDGNGTCRIDAPPERLLLRTGAAIGTNLPREAALGQNYPDPFNPRTTIGYDLPLRSRVRMEVYDVLGRVAIVLVDGTMDAGTHQVEWDASGMASGMYFCRLTVINPQTSGLVLDAVRKMLLIR